MDADMERAFNNLMKRIQKRVEETETTDEVIEVGEVSEVEEDDKE